PDYEPIGPANLETVALIPHLLLVHENVLTESHQDAPDPSREPGDYDYLWEELFSPAEPDVRSKVRALFERLELNIMPYQTNVQLSVLAHAFVEDNERNLLFRVYIPSGRIWAREAQRLMELFRDWLTRVQGKRVRHDGYKTSQGEVYEFYGEESPVALNLAGEFEAFSQFLDACLEDPSAAYRLLG